MRFIRMIDPNTINVAVHRPPRFNSVKNESAQGIFECTEFAHEDDYDAWNWLHVQIPPEHDVSMVFCSWRWRDQGWGYQKGTIYMSAVKGTLHITAIYQKQNS